MALLVMFTVALFTLVPFWLAMAAWGYRLGGRAKWRDTFRSGKGGGGSRPAAVVANQVGGDAEQVG